MKKIDQSSMNKKQYDYIIEYVCDLTSQRFCYLNLSDEISNAILVKLMKISVSPKPTEVSTDFINSIYPEAVEYVFKSYSKMTFNYCLMKTRDYDLSEDISQEAIKQLLATKHRINDVYSWLRQVTYNLLCKHYELQRKENNIFDLLCMEASIHQDGMESGNTLDIEGLNPIIKKELLSSKEYSDYEAALSFDNLHDYAISLNVSKKGAQKRKNRVIRNLRSKILLAIGWRASPEILNYKQYDAIQKFIRELLIIGRSDKDIKQRNKIYPSLVQVMNGIDRIDDWGITMVDNHRFRLHIFHLTQDKQPICATFFIVLNERNQIFVESCKKNEFIGSHKIPANIHIPKEMGKSLWTYEEIIFLINA